MLIVFIKIYSYRSLLAVAGRGPIRSIPIQSHVVVTGISFNWHTGFLNLGFVYKCMHVNSNYFVTKTS